MFQTLRFPKLAALIAGGVAACGFAPLDLWPLTLGGLAVLIALVGSAPTGWRAFARGWWWGVGHFTIGLNWIAHAFTFQYFMPAWTGYIAVFLLSLYLALYPAAAAWLAWRIASPRRSPATIEVPSPPAIPEATTHALDRTACGSSSGSGAAVADRKSVV